MDEYIKSNVCPLPWTHLEVDVNGGASPCCLYKGSIPNVKVYEQSLSSIQKHVYMDKLRQKFKNGERASVAKVVGRKKMQSRLLKDKTQYTR